MSLKATKTTKTTPTEDASLIFVYDTQTEGGGVCEGEENDSYPNYEDAYITMDPLHLARKPSSEWHDGCDAVPAEHAAYSANRAYLVVARYSDGDTFSHTYGHVYAIRVFANEKDAVELSHLVQAGKADIGYKPWDGYFSSFESVEVLELPVTDS